MKNLLWASPLALALLALASGPAPAGTFGLFISRGCCGHCCGGCGVCIRPYNAFTPAVSGTINGTCGFPYGSDGLGGGCAGGCSGGDCAPLTAIGDIGMATTPEAAQQAYALQYQYMLYQQMQAAQQGVTYTPIQSTGFAPAYNYNGASIPATQPVQVAPVQADR